VFVNPHFKEAKPMDYVSHIQRINRLFKKDARIDLEHISLYNSLFAWWHFHRDGDKVAICHKRMMRHSGIRSKEIYNLTLIELDQFGYIMLLPPEKNEEPCLVKMIILGEEKKPVEELSAIKKLVREIIDKVLLLNIQLEKEV
jgi:hypothetical protein